MANGAILAAAIALMHANLRPGQTPRDIFKGQSTNWSKYPGTQYTWKQPGGYGFLAIKPAFFERGISFFMGVTASAGWPAGVYRGVVIEGKGELKI